MSLLDRLFNIPSVTPGRLEADEIVALVGRPDPIIAEIGCNNGSQTKWFLGMFEAPTVVCFEPDPRACEAWRERVLDERATLLNIAIADTDGQVTFHMSDGVPPTRDAAQYPQGWDASGSIRKPKKHLDKHPWCTFDKSIEVQAQRLDSWFAASGFERLDFIWADVQGAEIDLINGGRQALSKTRYFYTEYNNAELYEGQIGLRKMLKLLDGFEVVYRYRNDVLLRNTNALG